MTTDNQYGGSVREGDIIASKYRVEKVLGAGGMGVVVAAYHIQLEERVAIKFLLPEVLGNADVVARFAREARAAVKIKSEHVARVIDVGTLENGSPYMVMEYLDGGDLSSWLEQRGALPIEQAVEFILQASEAIAEAHTLGIVHRDLKPANLFCIRRADGVLSIKVLDFGISKVTGSLASKSDMDMTRTTTVMGSPLYMSPEQFHSTRSVDARTDIWSLGAILHQLLAGTVPFAGETLPELCIKIATAPHPTVRTLRPEVPAGLEEVLNKCLDKDPNRRFANIAEFAVALACFGPKRSRTSVERIAGIFQSAGLSASSVALPPSASELPSPQERPNTEVAWGQTRPNAHSKRTSLVLGATVVLALTGVATLAFLKMRSSSPVAAMPSVASQLASESSNPSSTIVVPNPALAAAPLVLASASPTASSSGSAAPNAENAAVPTASNAGVPRAAAAPAARKSYASPPASPSAQPPPISQAPAKEAAKPPPTKPSAPANRRGVYDYME